MKAAGMTAAAFGAVVEPGDEQGSATVSSGSQKDSNIQMDTSIRYAAVTKLFRAFGSPDTVASLPCPLSPPLAFADRSADPPSSTKRRSMPVANQRAPTGVATDPLARDRPRDFKRQQQMVSV